jgi:predicted AAA+ superfamily ATPase
LPYIKERIDARRAATGQYLLTGSQNLLLMAQITESLAGRAATLRLLPLSHRELAGQPGRPLPWERTGTLRQAPPLRALWTHLLRGGYPELAAHPKRETALWHASYIQTYLERDVRVLRQVGDLTLFQVFLRGLAARSGQLLNLTDLARDLGVVVNTAKAWLSVLEATHQIRIVRPYFANVGKRLVKTPKVYFTDTGILCFLAGLRDAAHAAAGPMAGVIFETAVLAELLKGLGGRGLDPEVYFWRTSTGAEVDFVVDTGAVLVPIEVKTSATPRPAMAAGIVAFRELLGAKAAPGYVVHAGEVRLPLAPGVTALPFAEL